MSNEEYKRICSVYQVLTKRFDQNQDYKYEKWFKCYNPDFYGVKGENLDVLTRFKDLTLRHIFSEQYIQSQFFSDEYFDENLVRIEDGKICIHSELGLVTLYLLIYRLRDGINLFLDLLENIKNNYLRYIKTDDGKRIYKMKVYTYNEFIPQFEAIPQFRLIFHLFSRTNSNYMVLNWSNEVEIDIFEIKQTLLRLSNFNFGNLEAILHK